MNNGFLIRILNPKIKRKLAGPYGSTIKLREKCRRKLEGLYYLWSHKPYSVESAREYWSYPPCKLYGKRHTEEYYQEDDSFIRNMIESEISLRNEREGAEVARVRVAHWISENNIRKMLDLGCGARGSPPCR